VAGCGEKNFLVTGEKIVRTATRGIFRAQKKSFAPAENSFAPVEKSYERFFVPKKSFEQRKEIPSPLQKKIVRTTPMRVAICLFSCGGRAPRRAGRPFTPVLFEGVLFASVLFEGEQVPPGK
jgi:hypothetical protein